MAQRKLQQEIDKTFKKVAEGIATFESIFEKIQQAQGQTQKEKLEADLKKEIKKLQRQRDQIKTWAASNDVKDKQPLNEHRKLIENQMERFKACEKEMKTKAYSKEGLSAATRLDPKEKEKLEMSQFLSGMVEELERQIEQAEAEAESISATMKKGKKDSAKSGRLGELQHSVDRHKWHQGKLELILRFLENGNVETEEVSRIQEDIKYYVESNQDADFTEDDNIYDDLNLVDDEEPVGDEKQSSADAQSAPEEPPPVEKETKKQEAAVPRRTSTSAKPQPPPQQTNLVPPLTNMKPAPVPQRAPGDTLKYASAAAAAAASVPTPSPSAVTGLTPLPPPPGMSPRNPVQAKPRQGSFGSLPSPSSTTSVPPMTTTGRALQETAAAPSGIAGRQSSDEADAREAGVESDIPELVDGSANSVTNDAISIDEPSEEPAQLPPGLQDLLASFEATRKRSMNPPDASYLHRMLETSLQHVPDTIDGEKPRHYIPKNAFPTSSHYPQEPLDIFDEPELFEKLDVDALFYVFYYQQGTYQQFLAARELKRQSWRFHKKYLTWFQRHEEPTQITDEYEQGTYRYFDYESMWIQRRKTNLKFEYAYLEDEDVV